MIHTPAFSAPAHRRLAGAVVICAVLPILQAQSTIFNDTFADGDRTTQNLPASLAWHASSTRSGAVSVRNGTLDLAVADNGFTVWAYFPRIRLGVGEGVTLSMDLSVTSLPAGDGANFRFGLCNTNGLAAVPDGSRPEGNYQGYALSTFSSKRAAVYKRAGPAAPISSMIGIGFVVSDPAAVVWNPLSAAQINALSQVNTPYTVTLTVTRTAADMATIEQAISGGGLTSANRLITTDPSGIFSEFDTVGLYIPDNTFGDVLISRVALATTGVTAITNLSILTNTTTTDPSFTIGTVVGGGGTSGDKPIVIRAVGPTLSTFGITGTLADPKLDLFSGQTIVASNDDWGSLAPGFLRIIDQTGAFPLPSGSKDSVISNPALPSGGYTVQVSGVGGATGAVIAEIYDATPSGAFGASTPRLINVSVLKQINSGETLTAGFVISGSVPKQILVRAVGPTLGAAPFNVAGAMTDPKLDLFSGQAVINSNNDWGGGATLAAAFSGVGAFPLPVASKDAALLVTLAPGNYTARVSPVGTTGGRALVEVYEVP